MARQAKHDLKLKIEQLERRDLLAAGWQNPGQPLDVNDDSYIAPNDILLLVNKLNSSAPTLDGNRDPASSSPYYDVNGDSFLAPSDVLAAVNALNQGNPVATLKLGFDTNLPWDRITSNAAVEGVVSVGEAEGLWLRHNEGDWLDVSTRLNANDEFFLRTSDIGEVVGSWLDDGNHRLEFRTRDPRGGTTKDIVGIDLVLDRVRPEMRTTGALVMNEPGRILVPFLEPLPEQQFDLSKVSVTDVTGNIAGRQGIDVVIKNVKRRPGGEAVEIELAQTRENRSYVVNMRELAHDVAGNFARTSELYAHHFDLSTALQLPFGEYESGQLSASTARIFYFDIEKPDEFVWHGASLTGVRYELISSSGELVGELDREQSWLLLLEQPGRYYLRVSAQSFDTNYEFKASLGTTMPSPHEQLVASGLQQWEAGVHRIEVPSGDRIYFDRHDYPDVDLYLASKTGSVFGKVSGRDHIPFAHAPQQLYVRAAANIDNAQYQIPYQIIENVKAEVPLGTWLDATEMAPYQATELKYRVDDDQLLVWEIEHSTNYDHLDLQLRLPSEQRIDSILTRVTTPGFVSLYGFKEGPLADGRTRLRDATNPAPLPLNVFSPPPSVAESLVYRFEHLGERQTLQIDSEGLHLALYTNQGRALKRVQSSNGFLDRWRFVVEEPGEYFLVLTDQSNDAMEPTEWRAEWVENDPYERTIRETLNTDGHRDDIQRPFVDGLETYEFTIDASANDVFQLRLAKDSAQVTIRVVDDNGEVVASGWTVGDTRTWHAPRPGAYLISIKNATRRTDELKFEFFKLHNAPAHEANVEASRTLHSWQAMIVAASIAPSDAATQQFHANAVQSEVANPPTTATWYLIDHLGQRIAHSRSVDKPISAVVTPGRRVWMVIEQGFTESGNSVTVAWSQGDPSPIVVDEPLANVRDGELSDLGDVHEYLLTMEAGQKFSFASGSDLETVRVFFDGQEITNPSTAPLPAFRTRPHLLRIQSARSGLVSYRFELEQAAFEPDYLVDGEFSGFNVEVSGNAPDDTVEHRFAAPAGAWIYVDHIANRSNRWKIYDIDNAEIFSGRGDSSGLMQLPSTGEYRIVLQPSWDGLYGFAVRSPSLSPELPVGQREDVAVPFGQVRFLRTRLSQPKELYLDSLASGPAIIWDGEYGSVFFNGSLEARRHEGDVVVMVKGIEGRETVPVAIVNSESRRSKLAVGGETQLPIEKGMTQLFPIQISTDGSFLHPYSNDALVEVPPIEGTTSPFFRASIAGDYTAYVTPRPEVTGTATIELFESQLRRSPIRRPLELNQLVTGVGQHRHLLYHYEIELSTGDALWLTSNGQTNWIAPNGLKYESYARALPVHEDGKYAVEIEPQINLPFSFQVTQFSALPTLAPGMYELSQTDPVLPGAFRVAGEPGQVYGFDFNTTRLSALHFVRRSAEEVEVKRGNGFIEVTMPSDGEFFVFASLPSESVQLEFLRRQEEIVDGEFGRIYTRTPPIFHRDEYNFDVGAGDYLWVDSTTSSLTMSGPDDVPGFGFSTRAPTARGEHTFQVELAGQRDSYEFRVSSMKEAPSLPIGGAATLRQGTRYRLDIERAGIYAVKLPEDDLYLAIYRAQDVSVLPVTGNSIYQLEPGSYWVTWHGPMTSTATTQATVSELPQISRTMSGDELLLLEPGEAGAVEYHLYLDYPAGSSLFVDYHLDDKTEAWIRFGNEDWRYLHSLGIEQLHDDRRAVELRVVGGGLGSIRFLNVLGTPAIDSPGRVSLSAGYNNKLAIWTVDLGTQTNVTFRPTSRAKIESWLVIVDGRIWASALGHQSLDVSITNPGKAILFVQTPGLEASELIQFDVLARQQ